MGTVLKYVIYIAVIVAAFFILKGLWDGELTTDSSMKDMGNQVQEGVTSTVQEVKEKVE